MEEYLAIDLGASSGRMLLGGQRDGRLVYEEIHRFPNGAQKRNGQLCWEHDRLFAEIKNGLRLCKKKNRIPISLAIDTWGVDFVLLDEADQPLGEPVCYRDARTTGMDTVLDALISPEALYERTGIQKAIYNTSYQLLACKRQQPELLARTKTLLMTPQYFDFLLTGEKQCEYTIASTTQLLHAGSRDWDRELIKRLDLPETIFLPPCMPGTSAGRLRRELREELGFDCEVIHAASHDTASAVLAVPMRDDERALFLSSGTWSLLGTELAQPDLRACSWQHNFANEGGYGGKIRYLKNIMGLWVIQCVKNEWNARTETIRRAFAAESWRPLDFSELAAAAEQADSYEGRVSVNDDRFLAPEDMTAELLAALAEQGQQPPMTIGALAACCYHSLAASYGEAVRELAALCGSDFDTLHIVGGGCNAAYLNRLTALATGLRVQAGPAEATAIGNLLAQLLWRGEIADVAEARRLVAASAC